MADKQILMVVGSLRAASFNRTLAKVAARAIGGRAEASFLEYADVPFMNQDIEFPAPEAVARARRAVEAADGVWMFVPEYNGGFPAPIKNLVDWLSRPEVAGDYKTPRPLTAKPVALSGAGGRRATAGAREHMRELLLALDAAPVEGAGEGFVLPPAAWSTDIYEVPDADVARIEAQADALIAAL